MILTIAGIAWRAGRNLATKDDLDAQRRATKEDLAVLKDEEQGVTNHLHPESCAGRREAAGEALTGARTRRAIEHRKHRGLERRDHQRGRRPHRHRRNG